VIPLLRALVLVTAAASLGLAQTRSDVPLGGRVETRVREGGSAATAVVYAEPLDGTAPNRPASFTVEQRNKTFVPRVLGAPVGATIAFPNSDSIFHNVFSLSQPQPFDLGLYRSGTSKTRTFTVPSAYHLFCNIHPQMVAFVVVAPTPWITTAAPDGTWRLDVPAGRYRVTALSERAPMATAEVRTGAPASHAIVLTLDESTFVPALHLNKFGKPYPASAYKGK
jgi:plastocyanin